MKKSDEAKLKREAENRMCSICPASMNMLVADDGTTICVGCDLCVTLLTPEEARAILASKRRANER